MLNGLKGVWDELFGPKARVFKHSPKPNGEACWTSRKNRSTPSQVFFLIGNSTREKSWRRRLCVHTPTIKKGDRHFHNALCASSDANKLQHFFSLDSCCKFLIGFLFVCMDNWGWGRHWRIVTVGFCWGVLFCWEVPVGYGEARFLLWRLKRLEEGSVMWFGWELVAVLGRFWVVSWGGSRFCRLYRRVREWGSPFCSVRGGFLWGVVSLVFDFSLEVVANRVKGWVRSWIKFVTGWREVEKSWLQFGWRGC